MGHVVCKYDSMEGIDLDGAMGQVAVYSLSSCL